MRKKAPLFLSIILIIGVIELAASIHTSQTEFNDNVTFNIKFYNFTYIVNERALLVNKLNRTVREYVYISLPRNDTYVFSKIHKIEPQILRYEKDSEGNVFAIVFIEVEPGEKIWINLTYTVRVSGYKIIFDKEKAMWPPLKIAQTYTRGSIYWNIDNETLRNLAYDAAYSDNPLDSAYSIAKWVQKHLEYEVTRGRKGSDHAIVKSGARLIVKGDCVEAADTFVTMARILGIPARTVYGFMLFSHEEKQWLNLTEEEEGMELLSHWGGHMWAQIYVPPWGWIDVEMLEDLDNPKIGDFSNLHVPFGVEGKTFHGSGLLELVIPSYLYLEYQEFDFRRGD